MVKEIKIGKSAAKGLQKEDQGSETKQGVFEIKVL